MRKAAVALWICICLSVVGLAHTKAARVKAQTGGVTKELIKQTLDAWSTTDTSKIAQYYSKAPENIFFDIAPMQYGGWEEWAKDVQNLFADYKSFKLSLANEPAIHNQGNWAWSTELWQVDAVHKDGKTETIDGRDTAVWQKQGGRWLIVHEHHSIPLPMPAAENKEVSRPLEANSLPSTTGEPLTVAPNDMPDISCSVVEWKIGAPSPTLTVLCPPEYIFAPLHVYLKLSWLKPQDIPACARGVMAAAKAPTRLRTNKSATWVWLEVREQQDGAPRRKWVPFNGVKDMALLTMPRER